jgi:hypothetical protein
VRRPAASGGGQLITGDALPPGSIYGVGSDPADRELVLFLIQTQVNPGSRRGDPAGQPLDGRREALKVADTSVRAHMMDLGIGRDPQQDDCITQAVTLNQAVASAETAVAFFIDVGAA